MFCPSFELGGDAASAALRSAAPAIVRGFLPPADVNFSASGSLRVDVSPAEHANIPLKLPNASLVRPAERQLPLEALIALLRDPQRPSLGRALRADGRAAEAEAVLEAARRLGRLAS